MPLELRYNKRGDITLELNGVVVIDKPQDFTSHDVVAVMRRKLQTKKIGHTGTLDPMATGVLPICVGRATKIVDFLMDRKKAYACEMLLGSATDTQDQWGTVISQSDDFEYSEATIIETILSFVGDIDQMPPMYSALKVGGEKLVDMARQGIVIERETRRRTIYSIENIVVRHRTISFDVTCSKGTYIRTLCHDIGLKLGCFAHMTALNRTMTEPFDLSQAVKLDEITLENVQEHMISVETALSFLPSVTIKGSYKLNTLVKNGVPIDFSRFLKETLSDSIYKIYIDKTFWGIGEQTSDGLFMRKVLRDDSEDEIG